MRGMGREGGREEKAGVDTRGGREAMTAEWGPQL